ncbi:MAG TPA: hypothetical protein QGF58_04620 [Myxococcota bacterium]|nr:hypothetical protein [Myxococcota bacterium]
MFTIIAMAGPFGGLSTILGITALILQGYALLRSGKSRTTGLAIGLAVAAVLVGVVGEGQGMYMAMNAIEQAEQSARAGLWIRGTTIARTATTTGAFWGALNAILWGVLQVRSSD